MEILIIFLILVLAVAPLTALVISAVAVYRTSRLRDEVRRLKKRLCTEATGSDEEHPEPGEAEVTGAEGEAEPKLEPADSEAPSSETPAPAESRGVEQQKSRPLADASSRSQTAGSTRDFSGTSSPEPFNWPVRYFSRLMGDLDWEQFTAMKLFAWLGGLALFLGLGFFLQFAYEEGYLALSPLLRVGGAFLVGVGLVAGGLWIRSRRYWITTHTLCAAGIAILYADIYAASAFYDFIPVGVAFVFMAFLTAIAFVLADRLPSAYVAVLAWLGGFLTPFLFTTGQDRPFVLFSYIALLNVGLVAVAIRRGWSFLVPLGALATVVTQWAWVAEFFASDRVVLAGFVFVFFAWFFVAARELAGRYAHTDRWFDFTALLMPLISMVFVLYLLEDPAYDFGARPWLPLTILFLLDLATAFLSTRSINFRAGHLAGGFVSFLLLWFWTTRFLTDPLLAWAGGYYILFGLLHGTLPVLLEKIHSRRTRFPLAQLYPCFMLFLILLPVFRRTAPSAWIWPLVFLLALVGVLISILSAWLLGALVNLLLVISAVFAWITWFPALAGLLQVLILILGFTGLFFGAGIFFQLFSPRSSELLAGTPLDFLETEPLLLPALSALLPFILLCVAVQTVEVASAGLVFGTALILLLLLHGLIYFKKIGLISPLALASVSVLQLYWHVYQFQAAEPFQSLLVYGGFYLFFLLFSFLFADRLQEQILPWISSALAGVINFFLIYEVIVRGYGSAYIGLLPVVFGLITFIALYSAIRLLSRDSSIRRTVLTFYGGVVLFFITVTFPLQFGKEWLTIAWALEAVALLWLNRKVPHRGLHWVASGLLGLSFARLALNPAVLTYYRATGWPIFNWFTYAYGVVSLCFFVAGRWIDSPPDTLMRTHGRRWFPALGTVLLFLLVNIQVTYYFNEEIYLAVELARNVGQDMTYSLTWALFGLIVLLVGIYRRQRLARIASLGLLGAAIIKVFLYDLWQLGGLYRVASFVGLAIILIFVSFIYQRYLQPVLKKQNTT